VPSCGNAATEEVVTERDVAGVGACVRDAVARARGALCPPFLIGVAVGGARDQVAQLSKRQLLRRVNDTHPLGDLAQIEASLLDSLNAPGAVPAGCGPRATAMGIKMTAAHRHPDSYLVDVSFSCWAHRRGRLIW
jgi:fumarate hydratase class I